MSTKTTIFGWLAALSGLATYALQNHLFGPNPPAWITGLAALSTAVNTMLLGTTARDHSVSDESAGVAPAAKPVSGAAKLTTGIVLGILTTLALPCLFLSSGCNTPPAKAAYQVEAGAAATMTAAMTAWGAYVATSHPPAAQEQKVKDAFVRYQLAELAAIDATKAWVMSGSGSGTNAPPSVTGASAAASQALGELVALIQSFGVTLNK